MVVLPEKPADGSVSSHAKLVFRKEYDGFAFPERIFNVVYKLGREKRDGKLIVNQKSRSHELRDEKNQYVAFPL